MKEPSSEPAVSYRYAFASRSSTQIVLSSVVIP